MMKITAVAIAASGALAHLPVQEGVDATHSEPLKIVDVCRHDQEHAVYSTLDSCSDVDVFELVVPEDSPDFFIHVAIPVLPFDRALVPEDRRRGENGLFPAFWSYFFPGTPQEDAFPRCIGNDARPTIAVVGPGLPMDVGNNRFFAAHQNGCGNGANRLPFYIAEGEGAVVQEYIEDFPYYEEFESGSTVVGEKKFVDLKKGTYKFYVWDREGRKGDYLAVFGKNEDCYATGKGYGPVGEACKWLVSEDFHPNCGARQDIPACCCFQPLGEGVCPTDAQVLQDFCQNFRVGGQALPFEFNFVDSANATTDDNTNEDSPVVDDSCVDNESFGTCADLLTGGITCDSVDVTPAGAPAFVKVTPSVTCPKTCGTC